MRLVLDTDALVKLGLGGTKERLVAAFDVVIPEAVRLEAVDGGGERDDARLIAANMALGTIKVAPVGAPPDGGDVAADAVLPPGGERDAYRLYVAERARGAAVLASDDHRFHRRIRLLGAAAATPASLLVLMVKRGAASSQEGLRWLDRMRPLINPAQYLVDRRALEEGGKPNGDGSGPPA